jgi:hypothetical protein
MQRPASCRPLPFAGVALKGMRAKRAIAASQRTRRLREARLDPSLRKQGLLRMTTRSYFAYSFFTTSPPFMTNFTF